MINFSLLTKLKTKPVVYENVLIAQDSFTLEQLKELSTKRRAIEESINGSSNITPAIAKEISGCLTSTFEQWIQKLEQYLPLLENLVSHINAKFMNLQTAKWISDLKIRWSSALSSSSSLSSSLVHLKGPKFYQVNDISFKLAMILSLYSAVLRARAFELVSSDLVQASTLYRKAADVYDYLSREIRACLNRFEDKPAEATMRVSSAMSLICLAEAQAVAARKAVESGKSCSLLAKLHHGITEFLDEATTKESKDAPSRLMDYILSLKALHEAKSYQYTAESLKNEEKMGIAVSVVRRASSELKKSMPKEECWRLVFREVMDDLSEMLRKYERENEIVWHEKVSSGDEVPSPQGVKIVNLIPYQPQRWKRALVFKL